MPYVKCIEPGCTEVISSPNAVVTVLFEINYEQQGDLAADAARHILNPIDGKIIILECISKHRHSYLVDSK